MSKKIGWTQPLCRKCWDRETPDREPTVVLDEEWMKCCLCGQHTLDGIYIRVNPDEVPFPQAI